MDKLKSLILPYLKAYTGLFVAWLATANIDPHQVSAALQGLGWPIPDGVIAAFIGLATAVAVWLVPNKEA